MQRSCSWYPYILCYAAVFLAIDVHTRYASIISATSFPNIHEDGFLLSLQGGGSVTPLRKCKAFESLRNRSHFRSCFNNITNQRLESSHVRSFFGYACHNSMLSTHSIQPALRRIRNQKTLFPPTRRVLHHRFFVSSLGNNWCCEGN